MKLQYLLIFVLAISIASCGSSKSGSDSTSTEKATSKKDKENVDTKYKSASLLNRITRQPGVSLRGGIPVINRSIAGKKGPPRSLQPLYVLDGQIIGRSYQSVAQLVSSADVKKINVVAGPDAALYGAQGGYGVIEITTFQ